MIGYTERVQYTTGKGLWETKRTWSARCGFWAVPAPTGRLRHKIGARLEAQGVPLRQLILVEDRAHLRGPLPWRGDLREASFDGGGGTPSMEVT